MTCVFVRVNREGRERAVEIEHLTPSERREYFAKLTPERALVTARKWIVYLSSAVADLERERGRPRKAGK